VTFRVTTQANTKVIEASKAKIKGRQKVWFGEFKLNLSNGLSHNETLFSN
jgi:phage FluMu gp28-like protein